MNQHRKLTPFEKAASTRLCLQIRNVDGVIVRVDGDPTQSLFYLARSRHYGSNYRGQPSVLIYKEIVTDFGTRIYAAQRGRNDDLAISLALLVWAARHPHAKEWTRMAMPRARHERSTSGPNSLGWTDGLGRGALGGCAAMHLDERTTAAAQGGSSLSL